MTMGRIQSPSCTPFAPSTRLRGGFSRINSTRGSRGGRTQNTRVCLWPCGCFLWWPSRVGTRPSYTSDIVSNISSTICLFADDCIICREILTTNDVTALQLDLSTWSKLCKRWQIEINVEKLNTCDFFSVASSNSCSCVINAPIIQFKELSTNASALFRCLSWMGFL